MDNLKLIIIAGIMGLSLLGWNQVKKLWIWKKENELYGLKEELEEVSTEMYKIDMGELGADNARCKWLQDRRAWLNERIKRLSERIG